LDHIFYVLRKKYLVYEIKIEISMESRFCNRNFAKMEIFESQFLDLYFRKIIFAKNHDCDAKI